MAKSDSESDHSYHSFSTAPTIYSNRPQLPKYDTCFGRVESCRDESSFDFYDDPNESVETYVSTEPSDDEFTDEDDDDEPEFELVDFPEQRYQSDAIPATPKDFADLFPSMRRLDIRHDDSTMDGNMNLRIDTQVESNWSRKKRSLTLFHLRMHDLKNREFSLRRYCRDSGREVCHSIRKFQKHPERRPGLTRSFSSAIATFRKQTDSKATGIGSLKRNDSGYGSIKYPERDDDDAKSSDKSKKSQVPTNTIKLEFSNYAHVDVKRRGASSNKNYGFEYWGYSYTWKRRVRRDGQFEEVSYHLLRNDKSTPLAHIVPVPLTTSQAHEERRKGGWIPPCSMWIKDEDIINALPDVADVVVSTGIIALVDDAIKRRWHSTRHRQLLLPLSRAPSFRMNMEFMGPKRLIDEVFHRRPTSHASPPMQRRNSAMA